jgi:hypothetical protein
MVINLPNAASLADEALGLNPTAAGGVEHGSRIKRGTIAFSLLEVMIALAIFFAASFVILALVSSGLRTARLLRNDRPSCSIIAAELSSSNVLEEGQVSGDFGKLYPSHSYEFNIAASDTYTGMVAVAIAIRRDGQRQPESTMEIFRFEPNMKTRRLGLQPAP